MSAARARPEDIVQASIVDFIRTVAPQCLVFAVPNAATRSESGRPANAVPGLTAGVPDLILIIPDHPARVAGIEVKAAGGALSKAQLVIRDRFAGMQAPWIEARSIKDVRALLADIGVTTREAA